MSNRNRSTVNTLVAIELPTPTTAMATPEAQSATVERATLRKQWEDSNALAGKIAKESGITVTEESFTIPTKAGDFVMREKGVTKGKVKNDKERLAVARIAMVARLKRIEKQLADCKTWIASNFEGEYTLSEVSGTAFNPIAE